MTTESIPSLGELLAASKATQEFKQAVVDFASGKGGGEHIHFNRTAPPVKVLRTLLQLLDKESDLPVERVHIEGHAGCSDFHGTVRAHAGGEEHVYGFTWDCKWRAEQEGWKDGLGFPDQGRAAREYGYRCFKKWERQT